MVLRPVSAHTSLRDEASACAIKTHWNNVNNQLALALPTVPSSDLEWVEDKHRNDNFWQLDGGAVGGMLDDSHHGIHRHAFPLQYVLHQGRVPVVGQGFVTCAPIVSCDQTLFRTKGKGLGHGHRRTCRPGILVSHVTPVISQWQLTK